MLYCSQLQKKKPLTAKHGKRPKNHNLRVKEQIMNSQNNTPKIEVKKVERGYIDQNGTIYGEKEVVFNRRSFVIEGQQETAKKAKKSSHKSSYTPSNAWRGATVLGETSYTSQARTRYAAMAELVTRSNEVAL